MSLIPVFELGLWNAWILMLIQLIINHLLLMRISEGYLKKRIAETPGTVPLNKTEKKIDIFGTVILFLLFAYSIFLPLQLGTVWFYLGLVIFLLGLILGLIVSIPWVTTPLDEPLTKGLYRYSRHPIYLTIFLRFMGVGIASTSWLFLLFLIVHIILTNFLVIAEERFLLEKYGNTYREYMNKTPRWIGIPKSRKND